MDTIISNARALNSQILNQCIPANDILAMVDTVAQLESLNARVRTLACEVENLTKNSKFLVDQYLEKIRMVIKVLETNKPNLHDLTILQTPSRDLVLQNEQVGNLAPGITIPAVVVLEPDHVPDTQLYWIKNLGCYAYKINGVLIKGTIKRWKNSSWLYTPDNYTLRNANMRHFGGNPEDLKLDIEKTNIENPGEFATRREQLMHDILCNLAVAQITQK